MKRTRAVGIVVDASRVLLMFRKVKGKEYFVFPGGGVEENETIEAAVSREICEEASLEIKIDKLLYRLTDENCEHYFYLCNYISGVPILGDGNERLEMTEDNQYRPEWHSLDELSKTTIYPLEVRDWLITDLTEGFKPKIRSVEILIKDRRSA